MTQHTLLLTRSEEEEQHTIHSSSGQASDPSDEGIIITLTLDAAQVSAVVSAVQSESTAEGAGTDKPFKPTHTNIKLVNPKTTSSASATRHTISFTETATTTTEREAPSSPVRSSVATSPVKTSSEETTTDTRVFSPSSGGIKAVVTKSSSAPREETLSSEALATTSKVFTAASGGIKAVVTKSSSLADEEPQSSSVWTPSTASIVPSSSDIVSTETAQSSQQQSSAFSDGQSNASSAAAPEASASSISHSTVTVTTTATTRASSTTRSSNTRVAITSIVAKPVITDANGIPVVTVYETTGTAFVTASTPLSATPTNAAESKKNFFQTIDSSPTAKALTAIISALIILLIGLAIWLCMRRRTRRSKRRDSLFDFAPDATDAKSVASIYSEKTPIISSAAPFAGSGATYPFTGDQVSFGYDSRYVEAATSTPARSPLQAAEEYRASTSAVRFAGIYPSLSPERRKSSVDLGLIYRLASDQGQSSRDIGPDITSSRAEAHTSSPSAIPTIIQPDSSSPASQQEAWGQAHDDSPLAVPIRPARPASLSGSITKKIDEMYNVATPRSSMSVLPPVSRPWMRQARKWASMSSMGGAGPDRRPSVDRRLYQQQLPSRFSITTFATSVEASPDLGAFRPRRTAITEQHLGDSILRTDIFKAPTIQTNNQDANPFSDLAQVAPEHAPADTPSPMSLSEPWASTAPLNMQSSALQNEVMAEDSNSSRSSEKDSNRDSQTNSQETESEEGSSEDSLETVSQASAIDEEEEENIRALIKRRQSASSGKML